MKDNDKKATGLVVVLLIVGSIISDLWKPLGLLFILAAIAVPIIAKMSREGNLPAWAAELIRRLGVKLDEKLSDGDVDDDDDIPDVPEEADDPEPVYTGTPFDIPGEPPREEPSGDEGGFLRRYTEERKEEETSDCDPDHEHVEPSYTMEPDEKRREQLRAMLKNGLIDKKEYELLLRKYGLK